MQTARINVQAFARIVELLKRCSRMLVNNEGEQTGFDKTPNSLKESAHALARHLTGQRDEVPYTTLAAGLHQGNDSCIHVALVKMKGS